ncbi:MAG: flagellar biosynthetic protein FliO [Thermoclostridium sp.]|nr:flagellar biosynthetic protein FliO [Thermoclostridium sp.]
MFFELAGYILIFGAILYLAYIATRLVGKKTSASMQSRHMQVIEQISLGLDRRLLLIRVGSEYFVFLCGKKEFKQVARVNLDKEEVQEQAEEKSAESPVFDFRQIFDRVAHNQKNKNRPMTKSPENSESVAKKDVLQHNIRKLEQLRDKSYDKEV